jgi:hypothetical protein
MLLLDILIILGYFRLFHLRLFSTIVSSFGLFYVILGYCKPFHFRLFVTIISSFDYFKLFHFMLFRVCEVIVGYFLLLKVISPYVIINNFRLYYHRLFVVILLWLLMAIGGY